MQVNGLLLNSQRKATVNIKPLLLGIIISLLCQCIAFAQDSKTYVYQIVSDGEISDSVEWKVVKSSEKIMLESHLDGILYSYECNPDYSTRKFNMSSNKGKLNAVDNGKRIVIKGLKDGDIIDETIDRLEYPWYQNIGWAASNMLRRGHEELTFSLIRPDNFSTLNMHAEVVETEEIIYENEKHNAIKVKITLDGFLKHFWSGYYWYREDDYKMVKYHGTNGPPGSPVLTMLLINEFVN